MRYSDGFYLFSMERSNIIQNIPKNFYYLWQFQNNISGFECYSFTYYLTKLLNVDFDDATVWIEKQRNLLVIYTRDEQLLNYVILGIKMEFKVNCKPFDLGIHSFLLQNGKGVLTSMDRQSNSNKVMTSIMKTDSERVKLLEKLFINRMIYTL